MSRTFRRRHRLAAGATAVLAAAGLAAVGPATAGASFRDPSGAQRPKLYWFWPGTLVRDDELQAEVNEMADAGFGGAKILETAGIGIPPALQVPDMFQWGQQPWVDHISATLSTGRDVVNDVTAGPAWPWASPAVTPEHGSMHMRMAQAALTPSTHFSGPVPTPWRTAPASARLYAVTVARVLPDDQQTSSGEVLLDPTSVRDVTADVDAQGNVQWDVPEGRWMLFGFWQARTGQTYTGVPWAFFPNAPGPQPLGKPLVLDYMDPASTTQALDYFDSHLLQRLSPQARAHFGAIHEENLELVFNVLWTGAFGHEFDVRRGYDLTPYLPVVFNAPQGRGVPEDGPPAAGTKYDFPGTAGERVRRDYDQTLTDLWIKNHIEVTDRWAKDHGVDYSAQVYGWPSLDPLATAKAVDEPMVEDYQKQTDTVDFWRTIASGAHLSGARKTSIEVGVSAGDDYMWTLKRLKGRVDQAFSAGITEQVLHLYPYKQAPDATWPSWNPWSAEFIGATSYSETWNGSNPLWHHMRPLADYMGRAQALLRSGKPVADVAVYRDVQGYVYEKSETGANPPVNQALSSAGLAFDFVDPGTLLQDSTDVRGHRLVTSRPDYGALVVDLDASKRVGVNDSSDAMSGKVTHKLLAMARGGLPTVFVGQYPTRGTSYRDAAVEDAQVQQDVAALRALPNVRLAAQGADVPAALASLGVAGSMTFDAPQAAVTAVHRQTDDGDYWFLVNRGDQPAQLTGSFRTGHRGDDPERWDLWTGERKPIGLYRTVGDRVQVPIKLAPGETTAIAFREHRGGDHVVATDAEDVVVGDDGSLVLRSTQNGTRSATLSSGAHRSVSFAGLPAPLSPASWNLHVAGYVPTGTDVHDLQLAQLADWRTIPEIRDSSGIGTYTTQVTLPSSWVSGGRGAYLELGQVEGGVQVRVNGRRVTPASVPTPRIDVGPFLRSGVNSIEVELTTTLKNRLVSLAAEPGFRRFATRPQTQPYGLLGPVRLVPYQGRAVGRAGY